MAKDQHMNSNLSTAATCACHPEGREPVGLTRQNGHLVPMPRHLETCPRYETYTFMRVSCLGFSHVIEVEEAHKLLDSGYWNYLYERIQLTWDQFESLHQPQGGPNVH